MSIMINQRTDRHKEKRRLHQSAAASVTFSCSEAMMLLLAERFPPEDKVMSFSAWRMREPRSPKASSKMDILIFIYQTTM